MRWRERFEQWRARRQRRQLARQVDDPRTRAVAWIARSARVIHIPPDPLDIERMDVDELFAADTVVFCHGTTVVGYSTSSGQITALTAHGWAVRQPVVIRRRIRPFPVDAGTPLQRLRDPRRWGGAEAIAVADSGTIVGLVLREEVLGSPPTTLSGRRMSETVVDRE
jgi:hypothetical protein